MNGGIAYVDKRELERLKARIQELERFNVGLAQESHELQTLLRRAHARLQITDYLAEEIAAYLKRFE